MTVSTVRETLVLTLVTVLCSLVQARSVSKELLELNDHINTQFGFDYSNDEQFFSLIGVEVKSGEENSDSYSYEYYNVMPFDANGEESDSEYDEDERMAGANGFVEEVGKKKYTLPNEKDRQPKGRIIIEEYEDSDEYDENGFKNDDNGEEDVESDDNNNFIADDYVEENIGNKDTVNAKNNKDDNYVNDYDETHEINSDEDNTGDNGAKENDEDEEDYDDDYDYEPDDSEELDKSYYDNGEDEEKYEEYDENDKENDDYYEDYDYDEEEDNEAYANVNNINDEDYSDYNNNENNIDKIYDERKDKVQQRDNKNMNKVRMKNGVPNNDAPNQDYTNYDNYNDY